MRSPHNSNWLIVTVKEPVVFNRVKEETWPLNPVRRYVFNAHHLQALEAHIDTISDLKSGSHYRPLTTGNTITGAKVLMERYRDRGIGDLLFMTGPMAYLHHISGGQLHLDFYAYADRGQVFLNNPLLRYKTVLVGPTHYDDLQHYNYHWFAETATEHDEERDQLNVYDALYRQIGVNHESVDAIFKRPSVHISHTEMQGLDRFFYFCWMEKKIDLRATGYYVAAPFTHSPLRLMPYGLWLEVIAEAARRRPVIVVGNLHNHIPDTDISAGEFLSRVSQLGVNVINAIDQTPVRVLVTLISKAKAVISLDSGPLYVAQGLRVPAVSLWGAHNPAVRIGYDPDYMELAVWPNSHCDQSPCFAYSRFPENKCPQGANQRVCQVLAGITPKDVMDTLDKVERRAVTPLGVFSPKGAAK